MTKFVLLPLLAVLVLSSHLASAGEQLQAEPIHFGRQVRPILSENCFACHGPDDKKREAKLRLDVEDSAKGLRDGAAAIVPGQPEKSLILARIQATDPDEVMPPPRLHKTVTLEQRAILRAWIQQGAPWGKHWSYETVVRPAVSKGELGGSPNSEIDAFLAARLARENLRFSPEAEPATRVRRLALELTGLPPTL